MTNAEKNLLLKALCGYLPYGVRMADKENTNLAIPLYDFGCFSKETPLSMLNRIIDDGWIPYLRPMSSMTEEEKQQIRDFWIDADTKEFAIRLLDFYNQNYLDYRGLIPKGLALEAPKDMYK